MASGNGEATVGECLVIEGQIVLIFELGFEYRKNAIMILIFEEINCNVRCKILILTCLQRQKLSSTKL